MAGCYCSSLLAELGAETIRVEPPGGDLVRTYSPHGIMKDGTGLAYLQEGRNKYHVTLNLEKKEGRDMLLALAVRRTSSSRPIRRHDGKVETRVRELSAANRD